MKWITCLAFLLLWVGGISCTDPVVSQEPSAETGQEVPGHTESDASPPEPRPDTVSKPDTPAVEKTEPPTESPPSDASPGERTPEQSLPEPGIEPTPDTPPQERGAPDKQEVFRSIPLKSSITSVQPMTGIVLWTTHSKASTPNIQLEYSYVGYDDVVQQKGMYDWSNVEALLNKVKARGHQAILRFYFTYPGQQTRVPQYIKNASGYSETKGQSEGKTTYFPDWSNATLQLFVLDFHTAFAAKYDQDPRLAFLQVGFGLWAEYHIYDGPMTLGKTFPSKMYQAKFLRHMDKSYQHLRWGISIDSADGSRTPLKDDPSLLQLSFGLFDDSFLHKDHGKYNASSFQFLGLDRYKRGPIGGELSYYTNYDQKHALDANGPHGISFEKLATQYHVTYMIGNDQPDYQPMSRIKSAGMATGYKLEVLAFEASDKSAKVQIQNTGIAPLYYDAYVSINGTQGSPSLKGLLPGEKRDITIAAGGSNPTLTITSPRLVPGQTIQYKADLVP